MQPHRVKWYHIPYYECKYLNHVTALSTCDVRISIRTFPRKECTLPRIYDCIDYARIEICTSSDKASIAPYKDAFDRTYARKSKYLSTSPCILNAHLSTHSIDWGTNDHTPASWGNDQYISLLFDESTLLFVSVHMEK